ncbi:zinc finger BED domain-containing protein RICESLEEPER 2 [Tanacetum coccineum]
MKAKLKKYFEKMPPIITCAAALNPCFNVHGVELLIEDISTNLEFFDDSHANKAKKWFNDSLEGLYNLYYTKYGNPTTQSTSGGSSSRASGGNQISNLLHRLKEHKSKKARSDSAILNLNARVNITTDVWSAGHGLPGSYLCVIAHWIEPSTWKMIKRVIAFEYFLTPHTGAMDILTVQATSVASESAFSTSGRVLSIRRTKLTPSSLEMCMCLKDHLDAQKRKQHISSLEGTLDFEEEILTIEVQDNEATPLSDEEITLDVASQGTMASGSGGEELEFDYDLTHYDIDD